MQGAVVVERVRRERHGVRPERDLELALALRAAVPDHVVHEPRDARLDPLRLVAVLPDEGVEEGERLHVGVDRDLLRLFRFELGLEPGLGVFHFGALGFQGFELVLDGAEGRHAAVGHDFGQVGELLLGPAELRGDAPVVLLEPRDGQGDETVLLRGDGLDPFRLDVQFSHEGEDRPVDRLRGDIALGAGRADRFLGAVAAVVVVRIAVPPRRGLRDHLVPALAAAEEPLEEVDVVPGLGLAAVLALVVSVHEALDLLVGLPGAEGLPAGVVELAFVLLLGRVDGVPEHVADDGLGVGHTAFRPVSQAGELPDDDVGAFPFQVEGIRRPDVGGIGLVDRVRLVLHDVVRGRAADGKALLQPPEHLVLHARGGQFPLVLRERHQHVDLEPPRRGREVEVLLEGDELHAVAVELLDQLHEVREAPGDAVELRDGDHVDETRPRQFEEPLERRAVHVLGAFPAPLAVLLAFDQLLEGDPVLPLLPPVVDHGGEPVELGVEGAVFLLGLLIGRDAAVEEHVHDRALWPRRLFVLLDHAPPFVRPCGGGPSAARRFRGLLPHPQPGEEGVDLLQPRLDGHPREGMVLVLGELGVLRGVDPEDPYLPALVRTAADILGGRSIMALVLGGRRGRSLGASVATTSFNRLGLGRFATFLRGRAYFCFPTLFFCHTFLLLLSQGSSYIIPPGVAGD
ncbi:MAG TPA: hypothetical protein VNO22_08625 [Planctomycetota bacterium]|nr:hypothetical protein [Planctomycetota bacterium]